MQELRNRDLKFAGQLPSIKKFDDDKRSLNSLTSSNMQISQIFQNGGHSNIDTFNDPRFNLSPLIGNPAGRP